MKFPGRDVLAGVTDAGLSSLATFSVGIFAVRVFEPDMLGAYALCFRGVFLAAVIPTYLLLVPMEVVAMTRPREGRLTQIGADLRLVSVPAMGSALLLTGWLAFAPDGVSRQALLALTATGVATAFFSPLQDHVRRMLHAGGASARAMLVSAVQLAMTVTGLVVGWASGASSPWIPLGALATANLVSLTVGLVASRRIAHASGTIELDASALLRSGRWLLLMGMAEPAAGFASTAVVASLTSAAVVGYSEAARIVAQPLAVLSWGLSAVLGPRSVQAAQRRHREDARRTSTLFTKILLTAGAGMILVFSHQWVGNPLDRLLSTAYTVEGLVLAAILALVVEGFVYPYRSELLGASREGTLVRVEFVTNGLRILIAAAARELQAFALPVGSAVAAILRLMAFSRALRQTYVETAAASKAAVSTGPVP